MENKVSHIRVEGQPVGVVGLEYAVHNMVEWAKGKNEDEISTELLNRIEKRNYIPSKMKDAYRKALHREFKKYSGQEVEEEAVCGLQVMILGPGCVQCNALESLLRDVLAEMNLSADLQHVTDLKEIGRYGVMGTPALIINGKVVSVGRIPDKKKIASWLSDAV